MNKLTSRKFWAFVVGELQGVIVLCWGVQAGSLFAVIAGAVISVLCILGYLKAEKDVDVARMLGGK